VTDVQVDMGRINNITCFRSQTSTFACYSKGNSLHLIQCDSIRPPVIELGHPGAGVVGHDRGILKRAAVPEIAVMPVAGNV